MMALAEDDERKFDINLSGCSATIAIQTPQKIFLAWVGDCHAILCKKERKFVNIKLT
jgi:serine/threonine protein phosphatase PrpC